MYEVGNRCFKVLFRYAEIVAALVAVLHRVALTELAARRAAKERLFALRTHHDLAVREFSVACAFCGRVAFFGWSFIEKYSAVFLTNYPFTLIGGIGVLITP